MADNADNEKDPLVGRPQPFHDPLPYVVRVRMIVKEDLPPEVREIRVTAYSLLEAIIQASIELGGNAVLEPEKFVTEFVGPDEPAYWVKVAVNTITHSMIDVQRKKK